MHAKYNSHFLANENFWRNDSLKDDVKLKSMGINRNGDIMVPNEYYCNLWNYVSDNINFENFDKNSSFTDLFKNIVNILNLSDKSIFRNLIHYNIPFFIPAPTDGAVGDFMLFQKLYLNREYQLSLNKDYYDMANFYIQNQDNISVIILGAGVSKHHNLLHSIYARGARNAIYINTSQDYDNSDSGASPSEAITWGKLRMNADFVKVYADVSICFPLIVEAIRYEFNII
jgi:deoxyhypusine synthase